jgi:nitroreductase
MPITGEALDIESHVVRTTVNPLAGLGSFVDDIIGQEVPESCPIPRVGRRPVRRHNLMRISHPMQARAWVNNRPASKRLLSELHGGTGASTVPAMEFQDAVLRRRMVRDFTDEPVVRPLLDQLMANATRVPSAGYSQGFAFVVLTDPGQRRLFWETTSGPAWRGESESVSLTRAPVVILPLAHKQAYLDRYALPDKAHTPLSKEAHWPAPYWDIDTGFGVMLILLTATDLGLGALFFGIFQGQQELMDALGVPEGYRPIGAIAVGHPTPGVHSRPELRTGRRLSDDVVKWERWEQGGGQRER